MNVCELTLAVSHPPTGEEQVVQEEPQVFRYVINTLMFYDIYLYTLCYYICCLLGACMRCTRLCSLKPGCDSDPALWEYSGDNLGA
jgi:hypothetical protein